MKHKLLLVVAVFGLAVSSAVAADYPMVGGQAMYPTKNIIENAVNSADHTPLVAAVKAAGLRLSSADLKKQIRAGNGMAELTTVSGGKLWAIMKGDQIVLKDEKGNLSTVTIPNVFQSNGVIHVVDAVVMPN